jgi:hypothetical protein
VLENVALSSDLEVEPGVERLGFGQPRRLLFRQGAAGVAHHAFRVTATAQTPAEDAGDGLGEQLEPGSDQRDLGSHEKALRRLRPVDELVPPQLEVLGVLDGQPYRSKEPYSSPVATSHRAHYWTVTREEFLWLCPTTSPLLSMNLMPRWPSS